MAQIILFGIPLICVTLYSYKRICLNKGKDNYNETKDEKTA